MSCMWCIGGRFCASAHLRMRALAAVGIHFQGPRMLYQSVHSQTYHGKGNIYTVARREQVHVTPVRKCIFSRHLRCGSSGKRGCELEAEIPVAGGISKQPNGFHSVGLGTQRTPKRTLELRGPVVRRATARVVVPDASKYHAGRR